MFGWFLERKKFEKDTRIMQRALELWLGDCHKKINDLIERVDELEKVQRTLCDDIYDLQADMTLIHNIEGYEDWREEIGKPVSKPTDIVK